jgi:hypothetical protein
MRALRAADQLFFLFQRARHAGSRSRSRTLSAAPVVADFLHRQGPAVSRASRCAAAELALYQKICDSRAPPRTPAPDLVDLPAGAAGHPVRPRAPARRRLSSAESTRTISRCWPKLRAPCSTATAPRRLLIVNSENLNFVARDPDLDCSLYAHCAR